MATTSRGFPYPAAGDDVDVPGDILALANRANGEFLTGTAGARPTFGVVGRQFYATDSGVLSLDIGSAWVALAKTSDLAPFATAADDRFAKSLIATGAGRVLETFSSTASFAGGSQSTFQDYSLSRTYTNVIPVAVAAVASEGTPCFASIIAVTTSGFTVAAHTENAVAITANCPVWAHAVCW